MAMITRDKSRKLVTFLLDAERFVNRNLAIMINAPLQIYGGALLFSPKSSEIRNIFWGERSTVIKNITGVADNWDPCLKTIEGCGRDILISPNGELVASKYDDYSNEWEYLRVWDIATGVLIQEFKIRMIAYTEYGDLLPTYELVSYTFSPDSDALYVFSKKSKKFLDIATGTVSNKDDLSPTASHVERNMTRKDGRFIVTVKSHGGQRAAKFDTYDGGVISVVNVANGVCTHQFSHDKEVTDVAFSKDGCVLVSASEDGVLRIWDASSPQELELSGDDKRISAMCLSYDGKILAAGFKDGQLLLCDPGTDDRKHAEEGHKTSIWSIAFSPDSKNIATMATDENVVRVWNSSTGSCKWTFKPPMKDPHGKLKGTRFSPDGITLAIIFENFDTFVGLWDLETGEMKHHFRTLTTNWLCFNQNGQILATDGFAMGAKVWDLTTKEMIFDHSWGDSYIRAENVTGMALSPGGETLALASRLRYGTGGHTMAFSNTIGIVEAPRLRLWDMSTGECKQTVDLSFQVRDLSFLESGEGVRTEHGVFEIISGVLSPTPNIKLARSISRPELYFDSGWVIHGFERKRLLWIPPDYSQSEVAISANQVVLKGVQGRLVYLEFADEQ